MYAAGGVCLSVCLSVYTYLLKYEEQSDGQVLCTYTRIYEIDQGKMVGTNLSHYACCSWVGTNDDRSIDRSIYAAR